LGGVAGTQTGDPSVDAVLTLLEGELPPQFTASYTVTRKLGPNTTTAAVVRNGGSSSITVGDVRFIDDQRQLTCSMAGASCEDGILDARISDYSIGTGFWRDSPARALRVAYSRRGGLPQAATMDLGGLTATCVDVPVGPGTERYCATPSGQVAYWDTAAVQVALTGYQDTADPTAFQSPDQAAATTTG
jgi:hypothetical protein